VDPIKSLSSLLDRASSNPPGIALLTVLTADGEAA